MPLIGFDDTESAFAYKTDKELALGKWLFSMMGYPFLVPVGSRLTPFFMKMAFPIKGLVKKTIFTQFVGGETLQEMKPLADKLGKFGVGCILDYGVEGKQGEKNFELATEEFIRVIKFSGENKNIPFISIKVSAFASSELLQTLNKAPRIRSGIHDNENENEEWERVCERMYRICDAAEKYNVSVLVDAEESWMQDPIDRLTIEMMEEFNTQRPVVYNTIQLYRHDRLDFLKLSFNIAQKRKFILAVKLVRGAYMEKERERALSKGYASPIQPNKEATDRDFNLAIDFCINNIDKIACIVASHNLKSNKLATEKMEQAGIAPNNPFFHFSQLYGMSDTITFNLAKAGYHSHKYVPFGKIDDVIPYLMRRAQENSSVSGQTGRELESITKEIERRKLLKKNV